MSRKFANTIEIFSGEGYVADRVHRNTQPGNFWQLSYDIHTGRPGRPTHHKGMYITKSAAEQAARRVIVVQAPKVRNVVLTNTRENY